MGLIDGLSGVIYSNLIRESRYTLFFDGLVTTLEITVFALLLGIVIGLIVALVRVMHIKVLDKIAKAYVDIIRGTPAVVQLVIIYYAILRVMARFFCPSRADLTEIQAPPRVKTANIPRFK